MFFSKERVTTKTKTCEVLSPLHEIDSFNGVELKNYITSVAESVDVVIVDFSKVAYLNSSGLRELIQILKIMKQLGKALYFIQLTDDTKKIFIHMNLDRLFVFFDNLADALEDAENR